uniref:Deoxyribodipyrimidine photo-lyase n=1 Tax=Nothobranchius furzeri TaxID=105023 RepID=A0A8C6PEH3_NOTFU
RMGNRLQHKRLFSACFLFTFLAARSSFEATMSDRKRRAASSSSGKRPKLPSAPDREEGKEPAGWLLRAVQQQREDAKDQSFNRKRLRFISETEKVTQGSEGILYWMLRDQRVQDNWALIHAQQLAAQENLPLHVCFCLVVPKSPLSTLRHYSFLLKGLEEVAKECKQLNIQFHLLHGAAGDLLPAFVSDRDFGAVVTDFSPLREHLQLLKDVQKKLKKDVPLMQVDAHNVVPCWEASPKLEYAARTIRGKITSRLPEFLTDFPAVEKHPHTAVRTAKPVDWDEALASLDVDRSVEEPQWAKPGTAAGMAMLESFIDVRLKLFNTHRNDPNAAALSQLSPWIRFGLSDRYEDVSLRSLSLVSSSPSYPSHLVKWTQALACVLSTMLLCLQLARSDRRHNALAHAQLSRQVLVMKDGYRNESVLWNSVDGKMHGFMRMYWAKKILEWTSSPEEALSIALYLNDRYELDGQDPNGFVGCMWSICGIHDQGWSERPVFGKIRYMNYKGCLRKFDVAQFERKFCPKNSLKNTSRKNSKI